MVCVKKWKPLLPWVFNVLWRKSLIMHLHSVRLSCCAIQLEILRCTWTIAKHSLFSLTNWIVTWAMTSITILHPWLIITVAAFIATLGNQLPSEPHGISIPTNGLLWDQIAIRILESMAITWRLCLLLVESVNILLLSHTVGKVICLIQSILLLC